MTLINTHSHIYEPEFDEDREQAILRARQSGISHIIMPNINEESIPRMLSLAAAHPGYCHPTIGLHPEDVRENLHEVLDRMETLISQHQFIAIGECGLDFYWDDTYRKEQTEAFEQQLCWARRYNLPIIIHMRKAEPQLLEAMERHRSDGLRGIFHCFGGSIETATRMLRHEGFCLGIGGVVTFRKSHLPQTLQSIPIERIVLETDDPYLAPTPHRGKRNEPSFITHTARFVADIYKIEPEKLAYQTNLNSKRIFTSLDTPLFAP